MGYLGKGSIAVGTFNWSLRCRAQSDDFRGTTCIEDARKFARRDI